MPLSPLSKILTGLLVVLFVATVWLSDGWPAWSLGALNAGLLVLLPLYGWTLVKNVPPFDDRAFHKTLPPGDGVAFWNTVKLQLLVSGCTFAAIGVHCFWMGYGWRTLSYEALFLILPVTGYLAACGTAASCAGPMGRYGVLMWVTILGAPVLSLALLSEWIRATQSDLFSRTGPYNYRTVIAVAGVVHALIWWLVAVTRKRGIGVTSAVLLGAILPVALVLGDLGKPGEVAPGTLRSSSVVLNRLPLPPPAADTTSTTEVIPMKSLLTVENLGDDEFLECDGLSLSTRLVEVRRMSGQKQAGPRAVTIHAARELSGTGIAWGVQSVWERMRPQLPEGVTIYRWGQEGPAPEGELSVLLGVQPSVNAGVPASPAGFYSEREALYSVNRDIFEKVTWEMRAKAGKLGKAQVFSVSKGGSVRLPEGGRLSVEPLKQDGGKQRIILRIYRERDEMLDGPWLGRSRAPEIERPWVMAVDEVEKKAYALDLYQGADRFPPFASVTEWGFEPAEALDERNLLRWLAILSRSQLYVFLCSYTPLAQPHVDPLVLPRGGRSTR